MRKQSARSWMGLIVLLCGLLGLVVHAHRESRVAVHLSTQSSVSSRLQVFHAAEGHFTEVDSDWLEVAVGAPRAEALHLPAVGVMHLRLDPPVDAVTLVCDLALDLPTSSAQFEILQASGLSVTRQAGCLRLQPDRAARDPRLVLRFVGGSASRINGGGLWYWVLLGALASLFLVSSRIAYLLLPLLSVLVHSIPVVPGFDAFHQRAHWACAAIMLAFGMAYIVLTPPGAVADEEAHFAKIIRISQGVPFGGSGAQLLPNPRAMYGSFVDYLRNKEPFTREQLKTTLEKPLLCEATTTNISIAANGYFPHQYALPTAAYMVGCATGASFGWFLHAARALNLLLATALVAWGVAVAGRGKLGLFFIALLPMSLFQMASLSADAVGLPLGIAWLGTVSGIACGRLRPARVAPALWMLSMAIAFLKPGSAWILACLLFCKPAYDAAGESFGAAVLKHLGLPWMIHVTLTLMASGNAQAAAWGDSAANAQVLVRDPAGFLRVLAATFRDHGAWLGQTMIGVLGWLDVPLSQWSYWVAGLLGFAAFWTNSESTPRLPRYGVALAWLAIAGSLALIALPLFIYWTPPGAATISGLQGRYFTMTAAFALAWCSLGAPRQVRAILAVLVVVGLVAINLDAVDRLHEAYFVIGRR